MVDGHHNQLMLLIISEMHGTPKTGPENILLTQWEISQWKKLHMTSTSGQNKSGSLMSQQDTGTNLNSSQIAWNQECIQPKESGEMIWAWT